MGLWKLACSLGSGLGLPSQDACRRGRCGYRQNIPPCIWSLVSGQIVFLPCLPAASSLLPFHIHQNSSLMTRNSHMRHAEEDTVITGLATGVENLCNGVRRASAECWSELHHKFRVALGKSQPCSGMASPSIILRGVLWV